jgi:hypothetical protein
MKEEEEQRDYGSVPIYEWDFSLGRYVQIAIVLTQPSLWYLSCSLSQ